MGEEAAICAVHSWLTQEWKASPLTWASTSSTIRFLGLEIGRTDQGEYESINGAISKNYFDTMTCGRRRAILRHARRNGC